MNYRLTRAALCATAAIAAACLAGCGDTRTGPEAEIRAWIDEMQSAAEDERRRDIIAHVAEGYADGRDNNRDDINNTLRALFFRTDGITLLVDIGHPHLEAPQPM